MTARPMVIDLTTLAADRVPVVADLLPAALDVPADDFIVDGPVHFEGDVERGIREGHTKTKWTDAIKRLKAVLLPAGVLVNLRLRGACGSCPHATMTLKQGIERILRESVDPEIVVERVS